MATIIIIIINQHDIKLNIAEYCRSFDGKLGLDVMSGEDEAGYPGLECTFSDLIGTNFCIAPEDSSQVSLSLEALPKR